MSLITAKKFHIDYDAVENFEAGIELRGYEAKSIMAGLGSLEGARVLVRGGEVFIVGMYIPPFQIANTPTSYDPYRTRRLLMHKSEIQRLSTSIEGTGLSIAPVSVYRGRRIKLQVSLAKRKNKADKRHDLKERDDRRMMRQVVFGE